MANKFEDLTEQQKRAAELLLENDLAPKDEKRKLEEIAEEIGVTRKTLWEWRRRNTLFIEYKQHLTTLSLQDAHGELARVLITNLHSSQPSTKMLDLLAKMTPNALAANRQEVVMETNETSNEEVLKRIEELRKKHEMVKQDE
jgi:predicted DNA-binding protein YlxM (UPF0122 family)